MSIIKNIFVVILVFAFYCCNGQSIKSISKYINRNSKSYNVDDSLLVSIKNSNKLIIGFYSFSNSGQHVPFTYFMIGFNKEKAVAYKYSVSKVVINNQPRSVLQSFTISKEISDSLLVLFTGIKNDVLNHEENDSTTEFCSHQTNRDKKNICIIHDASYYNLIAMTKKHVTKSSFYEPQYFEMQCCPGNRQRQAFLSLMNFVKKVVEKN